MINFYAKPNCTACSLHETATNRGIPTRSFGNYSPGLKSIAVLVVGEAPGATEDEDGVSWVGRVGKMLAGFIRIAKIEDHADVYLANACRCRPPQNSDPTAGNLNCCRGYLQDDLDTIGDFYKQVVILCVGRWGTQAVTKQTSLKSCFPHQGQSLTFFTRKKKGCLGPFDFDNDTTAVFFTYHPGALLPHHQPGLITAVSDHLMLLVRYLKGDFIPNSLVVVPEYNASIPTDLPAIVAVDIETYGILKGREQTVFHPMKSQEVDGVELGEQIVTVAFGYPTPGAITSYRTCIYDWKKHRPQIRQWLRRCIQTGTTLLGQHIKFDLLYLKMNDPICDFLLRPGRLRLDDTLLASFLLYEQRPEKGLKELATLFGLTDYNRLSVTAKSGRASSPFDKNLWLYNCTDVVTTLALYDYTWKRIAEQYGAGSTKLSTTCADMRNAILWDTLALEEAGIAMDTPKLQELDVTYRMICDEAVAEAERYNVTIRGKGSQKSTLVFMEEALDAVGLKDDPRVELTEVKQEISVGVGNLSLLSTEFDSWDPFEDRSPEIIRLWDVTEVLMTFRKHEKLVSSYTNKLLNNQREGIVYKNLTYPSWYPMPSLAAKQAGTTETDTGGTLQGRFSCKKPAAQTYPPPIKKCIVSRFKGGRIRVWDLSQIELRIAALLSGDPVMIEEYQRGIDRHAETALFFFPGADVTSEEFTRKPDGQRQCGKTTNFLVLYKGGPGKLKETILKDMSIDVPLCTCRDVIRLFDSKYGIFRDWQTYLIRTVERQGYLELITGWSRYWGRGAAAANNAINEICDFPIQTIAAQFLQSAHFEMEKVRQANWMRSLFILQQHDSLFVDQYPGEEEAVEQLIQAHLVHPPLRSVLENELGRSVPIEFEEEGV